jgi:hypothetical protein
VKERPILFSAPMVRAILEGRKTQTRRICKDEMTIDAAEACCGAILAKKVERIGKSEIGRRATGFVCKTNEGPSLDDCIRMFCPYGQPGETLWAREAWRTCASLDHLKPSGIVPGAAIQYVSGGSNLLGGASVEEPGKLRQGMFMPRWASRILLEITGVRVERLQEIRERDCDAEGLEPIEMEMRPHFRSLWESINGPGSWEANPWVWVVEFRRAEVA